MAVKKNITRSQEFSDSVIDTVREPLIILDQDLRVVNASRSFYKFFKVKPEETVGQLIYDLGNKQWDIPGLRELLETILPEKTTFDDYEVEHDFATIGKRIMLLNARQIQRESGKERIILLAIEDITERKQLEELLEDSEERYRRLFETASDGIVLLEKSEGRITHANPASEKMLGYNKKEIVGNKLQDIGISLDRGDFQTTMQNLNKTGILNYDDAPVKTKSGVQINTDIYLVDRARLVQCNIRDITERKEAEEQLIQGHRELQALMDVSPIGICWADMKGNIQYNNKKFRDLFGYTVEDLPTIAAWRSLAYPDPTYRDQIPSIISLLTEARKQGKEADPMEVTVTCKDGSIRHVLQAWAITSNRILVTYADITERKQKEQALRETEERFAAAFHASPNLISITRLADGKIVDVNKGYSKMLGYSREESIGKTTIELSIWVNPADRAAFIGRLEKFGEIADFETTLRRKDGIVITVIDSARTIELQGETCVLSVIHDISERKQAEEALKESENKYRLIADNMTDSIAIMDMNLRFIYISPSIMRMRGYTPEEAMAQTLEQAMTPESLFLAASVFEEEMQREANGTADPDRVRIIELEEYRKDMSRIWVEVSMSFLRDAQGRPEGVLSLTRDITERKQLELHKNIALESLQESEKRYKALFDSSLDLVYIYDFNGRFIDANDASLNRLGYKKEDIQSLNFASLLSEDQLPLASKTLQEIRETGTQKELVEFRVRHKNGSDVYIEAHGYTIMSNGKPVAILSVARDITERKQAEDALKEGEKKYRLLADNIDDVLFVLDMNLNYTYASPAVKTLIGYEPEELLKLRASETMTPSSWDMAVRTLSEFVDMEKSGQRKSKKPQMFELEMQRKDGSTVWTEVKVSFIRDEDQRPLGMIGVSRDITSRKLADAKLQETLDSLRKAVGTTIQVLISALEARDPYTAGHQLRVAHLARAIATEMGLAENIIDGIGMAGSIHDIGKLSIPAEILVKPTKLTNLEFSLIKEHPESGYEMLKNVESPWPLAQIVYQHHERMNGSGYPRNLKGDEILMEARIMAVADVVEAMASHRPYRASLGIEVALEEIEKNKGILYDDAVAAACLRLFREKGYALVIK